MITYTPCYVNNESSFKKNLSPELAKFMQYQGVGFTVANITNPRRLVNGSLFYTNHYLVQKFIKSNCPNPNAFFDGQLLVSKEAKRAYFQVGHAGMDGKDCGFTLTWNRNTTEDLKVEIQLAGFTLKKANFDKGFHLVQNNGHLFVVDEYLQMFVDQGFEQITAGKDSFDPDHHIYFGNGQSAIMSCRGKGELYKFPGKIIKQCRRLRNARLFLSLEGPVMRVHNRKGETITYGNTKLEFANSDIADIDIIKFDEDFSIGCYSDGDTLIYFIVNSNGIFKYSLPDESKIDESGINYSEVENDI